MKAGASNGLSWAFARIFWTIAGVLAVVAIAVFGLRLVSLAGAENIRGTFEGYEEVQNAIPYTEADSGIFYYPVVSYMSSEGNQRRFVSPSPVPQDRYESGQELELRLYPDGSVGLVDFMSTWGLALILMGTSAAFFIFGLGALKSFDSKKY